MPTPCLLLLAWMKKRMDMQRETNYYRFETPGIGNRDYSRDCLCQGSRIYCKCDVTRRQRPIRARIGYITEKPLCQHVQNMTFGLFHPASLFRLTCWVHCTYPLVFIYLRVHVITLATGRKLAIILGGRSRRWA